MPDPDHLPSDLLDDPTGEPTDGLLPPSPPVVPTSTPRPTAATTSPEGLPERAMLVDAVGRIAREGIAVEGRRVRIGATAR